MQSTQSLAGPQLRQRNWAGNQRGYAAERLLPTSRSELQAMIASRKLLRVSSRSYSFNDGPMSRGSLLDLSRLGRILQLDSQMGEVKIEAGARLIDIHPILWRSGLGFKSLPDVSEPTLGGLIASGSHGSGLAQGTLSDGRLIQAVELILADGSLLELRADRADDAALLRFARLHLGALGVTYSVTLKLPKAGRLASHSRLERVADCGSLSRV